MHGQSIKDYFYVARLKKKKKNKKKKIIMLKKRNKIRTQ